MIDSLWSLYQFKTINYDYLTKRVKIDTVPLHVGSEERVGEIAHARVAHRVVRVCGDGKAMQARPYQLRSTLSGFSLIIFDS